MTPAEELAAIRRDMDSSVRATAHWASRVRTDHRQTRELIARAFKQLQESRNLLGTPEPPLENKFLQQSMLEMAERHVTASERHVACQQEIAARLRHTGEDSESADTLLLALKTVLLGHREELAAMKKAYGASDTREAPPGNLPATSSDR